MDANNNVRDIGATHIGETNNINAKNIDVVKQF